LLHLVVYRTKGSKVHCKLIPALHKCLVYRLHWLPSHVIASLGLSAVCRTPRPQSNLVKGHTVTHWRYYTQLAVDYNCTAARLSISPFVV